MTVLFSQKALCAFLRNIPACLWCGSSKAGRAVAAPTVCHLPSTWSWLPGEGTGLVLEYLANGFMVRYCAQVGELSREAQQGTTGGSVSQEIAGTARGYAVFVWPHLYPDQYL